MPSFTEDAPTYSVACTLAVVLNQQLIGSSYVISCHQAARVLVYCQLQLVCWIVYIGFLSWVSFWGSSQCMKNSSKLNLYSELIYSA